MERSSNQETEPPPPPAAAGVSVPADPTAGASTTTSNSTVVSGKGRGPYQSKGNQFLRHLAREALPRYQSAKTNREKIQITTAIVDEIQATGGEFWDPDHQAPLTNEAQHHPSAATALRAPKRRDRRFLLEFIMRV